MGLVPVDLDASPRRGRMSEIRIDQGEPNGWDLLLPRRPPLHYGRPMKPAAIVLALAAALVLPAVARAQGQLAPIRIPAPSTSRSDVQGQLIVQFKTGVSAAGRGGLRRASRRQRGPSLRGRPAAPRGAVRSDGRDGDSRARGRPGAPRPAEPSTAQWPCRTIAVRANSRAMLNTGQAVYGLPGMAGTPDADIDATTHGIARRGAAASSSQCRHRRRVRPSRSGGEHWSNPADPPGGESLTGTLPIDVHGADLSTAADPRSTSTAACRGHDRRRGNNGIGVAGMNWPSR